MPSKTEFLSLQIFVEIKNKYIIEHCLFFYNLFHVRIEVGIYQSTVE